MGPDQIVTMLAPDSTARPRLTRVGATAGDGERTRLADPTKVQMAIAERRALVRICFLAFDAALVTTTVVLLLKGDKGWWLLCPGLVSAGCLTLLWGWSIPAAVDSWRLEQTGLVRRADPSTKKTGETDRHDQQNRDRRPAEGFAHPGE
jgi:hypothetical protein